MKFFCRKLRVESRAPARLAQKTFRPQPSTLNPQRFNHRAFTLVEIMMAVAVFSIIIAAIYSTWILVLRSAKVGQEVAAQVQRQRIAVRTIEDSLSCIQSFQASMSYYSFIVQNGDQPVLSFTSRLPDIFPRNGRFDGFNLRRLTFAVEPGVNNEKNLVLRQNPILMDMDSDEQANPLVLARNVKDFVVECWDTNAMDWVDEWDDTNSIPRMVRVTLTLGDKFSAGIPITREIAVPSSTLPTVVQTGGGGGGINRGGGAGGSGGNNNNLNKPKPSSPSPGPHLPNSPHP